MAAVQGSYGPIDRIGIKKVWYIEADRWEDQSKDVLGNEFHTTQAFEIFLTERNFGPASIVPVGQEPQEAQGAPVALGKYTPVVVGMKWSFLKQLEYTDQYGIIKGLQAQAARSFTATRNIIGANININGFSTTLTSGPLANEPLYSTAHAAGVGTGSNRPSPDIAFSPLGLQQMKNEMRAQKDPNGLPMETRGKIVVTVPTGLWQYGEVITRTQKLPGTNFNDDNVGREDIEVKVNDWYSNTSTAWYARHVASAKLFCLNQMPYDVDRLQMQLNLMLPWVASESYVDGWSAWQSSWGTQGA